MLVLFFNAIHCSIVEPIANYILSEKTEKFKRA